MHVGLKCLLLQVPVCTELSGMLCGGLAGVNKDSWHYSYCTCIEGAVRSARRFRVLDECDEMLNMGFVDDVEKILGAGGDIQVRAGGCTCLASSRERMVASD